jgi:hypothetical protein
MQVIVVILAFCPRKLHIFPFSSKNSSL